MARILTCALFVGLSAVLPACGEKRDITSPGGGQPLTVVLDFFPNADHAGLYAAMADGEFAKAGLRVMPQAPSDPSAPLKLLAAGKADVAISYEPELLLARDRGIRLVSIGALVQEPLTSVIALGSKRITRVSDLAGKRVGTAGIPYQSAQLSTVLRRAGVAAGSVQETNVGFNLVPAMLSGRVDATLGGFWNYEGIQLTLAHKHPTVIHVDRAGVPTYDELVLVVREDEARHQGGRLRAFLQALTRGEQAARRDPPRAITQLLHANHDLDRRLQLASLRQTLPVAFPADASRPFGYQDPRSWDVFGRWMLKHGLLKREPHAAGALTNEFLPGQGV